MKIIGRYEIVGRLGRGGMSTVYKARAPVTGRLVALKILQPRNEIFAELAGEERLRELFVAEAKIMGALSHDHVAKVIDCAEHQGQPFIVLEYFSHSLGGLMGEAYQVEAPSRTISAARTQAYLGQALKGLERLHFAGIVHRDIKPYNLMLTSDDRVKIIDFGLSRVRGEERAPVPGMQVGSPFYAAPEQESDPQRVDGRADLFSLGVMGLRMLTGRLFDTRRPERIDAGTFNPGVGPLWDAWLRRSIAMRPGDRFQNAQEMRLALQALPSDESPDVSCSHRPAAMADSPQRSQPERVMYKDIRTALGLDELFRPLRYHLQQFSEVGPLMARERHSGLIWQRQGPGFTLDWQQAREYVVQLNSERWQGRNTWRLPTVAEALTILRPPLRGPACSTWPLFDSSVHWLWTSDPCTRKQTWTVDVVESFFERLDVDGTASVCAVSSS